MIAEASCSDDITQVLTKYSHHWDISIIMSTQNAFSNGKYCRTQSLQAHYLFLLRSCRERKQLMCLGSQIFPGKSKQFLSVYDDIMNNTWFYHDIPAYMLIVCHPIQTKESVRLLTNVFPSLSLMILYKI